MEGEGGRASRLEGAASYGRAEWRIELFSVGVGMLATAVIACVAGFAAALGFLIGAAMSWLNFRWLKQGVNALVGLAVAQEGAQKARVPAGVYVKFVGAVPFTAAGGVCYSFPTSVAGRVPDCRSFCGGGRGTT